MRNIQLLLKKVICIILTVLMFLCSYAQQKTVVKQPNIIFILTDDMGYGDISCFNGRYSTPNIDHIAAEGRMFTNYYSMSPICSPSRVGFLTGMAPAKWNITSFLHERAKNKLCGQADFLNAKAPSIARILKANGYATGHFGKWHMGGGRDVYDAPSIKAYGFDEWSSTYESPDPDPLLTDSTWIWSSTDSIKRWNRTAYFVDRTLTFLKKNKGRPCYVNVWPDDVHTPWVPGEGQVRKYPGTRKEEVSFIAVLKEYDKQIGRLMEGLKELGIYENSIIIFASDNGPFPNFRHDRSANMRGSKWSLYDGGIRLPLIVRWPHHVPAGTKDTSSVLCSADLLPTFCKIAEVSLPKNYAGDGEDKTAVLMGKPEVRKKAIYWEYGRDSINFEYPHDKNDKSPSMAIREGKWKLLMNKDRTREELFDMENDKRETNNVADKEKEIVERLGKKLLAWWNALPVLIDNNKN